MKNTKINQILSVLLINIFFLSGLFWLGEVSVFASETYEDEFNYQKEIYVEKGKTEELKIMTDNTSPANYISMGNVDNSIIKVERDSTKDGEYDGKNIKCAYFNVTGVKAGETTLSLSVSNEKTTHTTTANINLIVYEKGGVRNIDCENLEMLTGEKNILKTPFSVEPENCEYESVKVTSSNEDVLKINKEASIVTDEDTGDSYTVEDFMFTGISEGKSTVTVEVTNKDEYVNESVKKTLKKSFEVTVYEYVSVTSINSEDEITVYYKDKDVPFDIDFNVLPEEETDENDNITVKGATDNSVRYEVEDEDIVCINEEDKNEETEILSESEDKEVENEADFTAKKTGKTKVKIISNDNEDITREVTVNVKDFISAGSVEIINDDIQNKVLNLTEKDCDILLFKVSEENASEKECVFESNNEDVVYVDENTGEINALKAGTCKITCKNLYEPNIKDTITVNVSPFTYVYDISLDKESISLKETKTDVLNSSFSPATASNPQLVFSSSDIDVATVDENTGEITAVGKGECEITVSSIDRENEDENIKKSCKVKVSEYIYPTSIVSRDEIDIVKNKTVTIFPKVSPENAENPTLSFEMEDEDIAIVDDKGNITGIKVGSTILTIKAVDGKDVEKKVDVFVTKPKQVINTFVNSIKVKGKEVNLNVGYTSPIEATVSPDNADNKKLNFISMTPNIASVNEDGIIKANGVGTGTINICSTDGSNIMTSIKVNVDKINVKEISIENEDEITLAKGDDIFLLLGVLPNNCSNNEIGVVSSDKSVATVDLKEDKAYIKAVDYGNAKITVFAKDNKDIKKIVNIKVIYKNKENEVNKND